MLGGMRSRGDAMMQMDSPFGTINGDEGVNPIRNNDNQRGPVNENSPLFQYEDVESNR